MINISKKRMAQLFVFMVITCQIPFSLVNASVEWSKHYIGTDLDGAYDVCVHDIDDDGDPDVVAVGRYADDVIWFEAQSDPTGGWLGHVIDYNLDGAIAAVVADMDGDGNPDVIASGEFADTIMWYEAPSDPTLSWTEHVVGVGKDSPYGLAVTDVNEDGDPEVVACIYGDGDIVWIDVLPWGVTWFEWFLSGATDVKVADIDGDGLEDVVATGYLDDTLVWYEKREGTPGFFGFDKYIIDSDIDGAWGISVDDLDNDGDPDIVAAAKLENRVYWYENPADPTENWNKYCIDYYVDGPVDVFICDINDDNNPDVVVGTAGYSPMLLWYEAPKDPRTGLWEPHVIDDNVDAPVSVFVEDIDQNGTPDVVVAASNDDDVIWYSSTQVLGIDEYRRVIEPAPTDSVYYIPTGNIYDDSAFYAFYNYKEYPQVMAAPTQSPESSAYLDVDGSPLFDGEIVTFGGRFANRMVAYYEDAGLALVGFANNGTHRIFKRVSDGSHLYAVESSTYNADDKDYFVFQTYRDGDRYIFSEWGFGAQGTYAGGACFIDIIYPYIQDYTNQYYIYSWTDSNNDDMPQPGEITLETSGS